MKRINRFDSTPLPEPDEASVPEDCREVVRDLFDTWHAARTRNARLTRYYEMKNSVRDFGISIPPQLRHVEEVVGWAAKAIDVRANRIHFDGFVFSGDADPALDALVTQNRMQSLVGMATRSALVHGTAAMTVMRGNPGQPAAKVRAFSANQCCTIWDKDVDGAGAGIILSGVDRHNRANRYVVHLPDRVLTFSRGEWEDGGVRWGCTSEDNGIGAMLMVPIINAPDLDRPVGRSVLTPELTSIVDKAIRDVLRMDVGAEFFTAPQRYVLGAAESTFAKPLLDENGDPVIDPETGDPMLVPDEAKKLRAYLGALWAFTRDENGDVPQVGQFPAGDAHNFISVYENDAQRFSGAANVPLAQLGVLSNNYTSSDALGAANDPLILDVQNIIDSLRDSLWQVARLMMAVSSGVTVNDLTADQNGVRAYFADPSMPTLAARADAWTKLAGVDKGIVGTRVFYEGVGLDQATIDRLMSETANARARQALAEVAQEITASAKGGATEE